MYAHEGLDLGDELFGADEGTAPEVTLRQQRKPTLNLIEPGRIGGGVVEVKARSRGQPATYCRMLVSSMLGDATASGPCLAVGGMALIEAVAAIPQAITLGADKGYGSADS